MSLKKLVEKHFTCLPKEANQKMKSWQCKYCTNKYAEHTTRMGNHLADCNGCPDSIKAIFREKIKSKEKVIFKITDDAVNIEYSSSSKETNGTCADGLQDSISTQKPENSHKKSEKCIEKYFDRLSVNDQKHAEKLLAKAIYSSGTPLSIVENEEWIQFFNFLRPNFKTPSRHDISNKLLNTMFEDVQSDIKAKINDAHVVGIQIDGFSNIRNEGILNIIVTTPQPVLYRSVDSSLNSQNADYIANLINETIEAIGPNKVLCICTDNASACKKAWRIIEDKYHDHYITCYGCVSHILHLLVKDILNQPSANETLKTATAISKEIKYSHTLAASFAIIQKFRFNDKKVNTTLKIPGKTRWGSSLRCLESLSESEQNLKQLAISENSEKLDTISKQVILSEEFWMKVRKLILMLRPLIMWLEKTESNVSMLSKIPQLFLELETHFVNESKAALPLLSCVEFSNILKSLDERKKMALKPIHFAANILDPAYKGKYLNADEFADGSEYIINLCKKFNYLENTVLLELTEYNSDSGIFRKQYVQKLINLVNSYDWWKGTFKDLALSKIAISILSMLCSSAATERSFNTYSWIHSAKRNKLTNERVAKIVSISYNNHLAYRSKKLKKDVVESSESEDENEGIISQNLESVTPNEEAPILIQINDALVNWNDYIGESNN